MGLRVQVEVLFSSLDLRLRVTIRIIRHFGEFEFGINRQTLALPLLLVSKLLRELLELVVVGIFDELLTEGKVAELLVVLIRIRLLVLLVLLHVVKLLAVHHELLLVVVTLLANIVIVLVNLVVIIVRVLSLLTPSVIV